MKSLLALLTGLSIGAVAFSGSLTAQCLGVIFTLYAGFTWARFDRLEGFGGSCEQGRGVCDCSRKEG